jgi:hypothetical protein
MGVLVVSTKRVMVCVKLSGFWELVGAFSRCLSRYQSQYDYTREGLRLEISGNSRGHPIFHNSSAIAVRRLDAQPTGVSSICSQRVGYWSPRSEVGQMTGERSTAGIMCPRGISGIMRIGRVSGASMLEREGKLTLITSGKRR